MKSIQEHFKLFLENDYTFCSGGRITGHEMIKYMELYNGTIIEDFLIFDNAGGRPFDIQIFKSTDEWSIDAAIESLSKYVLMYRKDGKETIIKPLPTW